MFSMVFRNKISYHLLKTSLLIITLFIAAVSQAQDSSPIELIELPQPTNLYKKPNSGSEILVEMPEGKVVEAARKAMSGWRKVRFKHLKKVLIGFAKEEQLLVISDQLLESIERTTKKQNRPQGSKTWVGLNLIYSSLSQAPREFSLSDSASRYRLSELSASGFSFGLQGDFSFNDRTGGQLFLNHRRQEFKGQALLIGATGPLAQQNILLRQDLLSLGGLFRIRPVRRLPIWLGIGGEVGRGVKLFIDLSTQGRLQTSPEDFPLQTQGFLALGGGLRLSTKWSLQGQLRWLQIFSTNPSINGFEGFVGLGYGI